MNREQIVEIITPIFRTVFSAPELILTDELSADDLENWGSLTNMTMMSEVEHAFGIQFKLKELKKLNNVGELISAIESKL